MAPLLVSGPAKDVPATRRALVSIRPTAIKAVANSNPLVLRLAPSAACAAFVLRQVPAAIPSIPTQLAAARRELEVLPRPSRTATDVSAPPEVLACTPPIPSRVPVPPAIWNAASANASPAILSFLPPAATQPSPPAAASAQPFPTAARAAAPAESAGPQPTPPKAVVPPSRHQLATSASVPLPVFAWAAGTV